MIGKIHSIETCGAVDGPGIRSVVFFQGCPLRCLYCHNPDTWPILGGRDWQSEKLVEFVAGYKTYFDLTGGGVTASGGEPTLQAEFLGGFFSGCRERGIHTALDTCGYVDLRKTELYLEYTDLVLLDIKHLDSDKCRDLTGRGNKRALAFLELLQKMGIPVILRQVVFPGWTDTPVYNYQLHKLADKFSVVEKIECLPYHRMGEKKTAAFLNNQGPSTDDNAIDRQR